jgi:hypothetical protein
LGPRPARGKAFSVDDRVVRAHEERARGSPRDRIVCISNACKRIKPGELCYEVRKGVSAQLRIAERSHDHECIAYDHECVAH